eukprot:2966142-Pyramimonas_sp.AAC.1
MAYSSARMISKLVCSVVLPRRFYPGKASCVLGWGGAGLLGTVAVHLPNVDAGVGYYRPCLSCIQSAPLPAAAAAHIALGDFNFVFSDGGRFNLDDGAATRGGTAFT